MRRRRSSPPMPRPDFSIKTKAIETSVFLDAQDQGRCRRWPANCLAEGRKWVGEEPSPMPTIGTQAGPGAVPQRRRGRMERKYQHPLGGRWPLCQHRQGRSYEYAGGAHPNSSDVDTILWDTAGRANASASARSSPRSADDGPTLTAMRRGRHCIPPRRKKETRGAGRHVSAKRHRSHRAKASQDRGRSSLTPSTEARQELRPDLPLLTLHGRLLCRRRVRRFRAVGDVEADTLTPEGVKIFGGARPKDDEDRQQ